VTEAWRRSRIIKALTDSGRADSFEFAQAALDRVLI
jgi:hypothetical protein